MLSFLVLVIFKICYFVVSKVLLFLRIDILILQWTQVTAGDEDSRHSTISNSEEPAAPPAGTGIKLTLFKPSGLHSPQQRSDKRKKADLREVFNPDEDDTATHVKKRKLVPLGKCYVL